MTLKEFIKFLLIEGICNGELREDFDNDKNSIDEWVEMWYNEYTNIKSECE